MSAKVVFSTLALATTMSGVAVAPAVGGATGGTVATSTGGEARCRYAATQVGRFGWTEARLRRIVVTPPTVYGTTRGQTVGWRFVVQRSIDGGAWSLTYRSPVQTATASPSRAASFSKLDVDVALPRPPAGADWDLWDVHYRVTLKTFWYRADGTVEQRSSHRFERHSIYVDGVLHDTWAETCQGEIRQFFDGP